MHPAEALGAFLLAAVLLTITPGLDTMLVIRTTAGEGRRTALAAALGIQLGCLAWGAAVALGLGALLAAAPAAYTALTWAGAAYLAWMGLALVLRPRRALDAGGQPGPSPRRGELAWLRRGFLTNILNPKVGVFYVSFLPQFVPAGWSPPPVIFGLAVLHAVLATGWLSLLIGGTGTLRRILQRGAIVVWLDRATGAVFIAFGLKLAFGRPA